MQGTIGLHCKEVLCEEMTMQQPIATNDVNLFSVLKENQYFDRKSARKDDREMQSTSARLPMPPAASW